jgi:uncharacterized protein
MVIEFDPAKSAENEIMRGIPFTLAERLDWSTALIVEDTRRDYGERRFRVIGHVGTRLHVMIFTPRADKVRVISLRKANDKERTLYELQAQV